jgi:hypothetical protein
VQPDTGMFTGEPFTNLIDVVLQAETLELTAYATKRPVVGFTS